ncbi:MAG TPA: type IV toxin-antitoxin system AbiEi family antitoxin domain-containing protein [Arachnia sp.]|nr:type IV toxin-antitoxin system AbiEi family antitoxin domain-containing protein [Arachnia sp.]
MQSRMALRVLAEVSESQWGMVTSAQARARGVTHMNLTRLTETGDLVRVAHGVYRDAGAPSADHEELRAAWLMTDPARLAYERLSDQPPSAVVSGESASRLHRIGDLRAVRHEFTTPRRRQTQRPEVRYRTRVLPEQDVTVRDGLPVTTKERTIADLVEDRQDLSIVGDALRDAAGQSRLDTDRLTELLSPLAERNGYERGDGDALLSELLRIAGLDLDQLAERLAAIPDLSSRMATNYLNSLSLGIPPEIYPKLSEAIFEALPKLPVTIPPGVYLKLTETISEALRKMPALAVPDLSAITAPLTSGAASKVGAQVIGQLTAADRVSLAAASHPKPTEEES